jgi:hypothetical protein
VSLATAPSTRIYVQTYLKFHTLRDTVALMGLVTIRATLQESILLGQHQRAWHGVVLMSTDWQPGGDNGVSCKCAHKAALAIRHRMDGLIGSASPAGIEERGGQRQDALAGTISQ